MSASEDKARPSNEANAEQTIAIERSTALEIITKLEGKLRTALLKELPMEPSKADNLASEMSKHLGKNLMEGDDSFEQKLQSFSKNLQSNLQQQLVAAGISDEQATKISADVTTELSTETEQDTAQKSNESKNTPSSSRSGSDILGDGNDETEEENALLKWFLEAFEKAKWLGMQRLLEDRRG